MRRIYKKRAAEAARGLSTKRTGVGDAQLVMPRSGANICFRADRSSFFFLDEFADPPAYEVANHGHAHSDHEHVEAGAEGAATREHGPGGANQAMSQHRECE